MRIVMLADSIPPEAIGGAGKIAWILAQGLADAGHDVHVIATTQNAPQPSPPDDSLPVHLIPSTYAERWRAWVSLYNPQTVGAVAGLLKKIQPDVVHAHNIHSHLSYASLRTAHQQGARVILTAHDAMSVAYGKVDFFVDSQNCASQSPDRYRLPRGYNLRQNRLRYNPVRNVVIRQVLRRYTHARTAVSHALADFLNANGLPPFIPIHNGLPQSQFDPPPTDAIKALKSRLELSDQMVILFGGRLSEGKGGRQILAAMDQLVQRLPNTVLLVLSAKPIEADWLRDYPHLTRDHIREAGWLADDALKAAYHTADVVTVPSIYLDPFPTITLEAMGFGKPVVVTCFGGASEAVIDGETGDVVNPFDAEMFSQCLYQLLSDDERRHNMGAAARHHYEQYFTLARHIATFEALYQESGSPSINKRFHHSKVISDHSKKR